MNTPIKFFVPGIPAPGGSKRGFALKKGGVYTGRVIITDDAGQRNKDWRQACVTFAHEVRPETPLRGALRVNFSFVMPRLKAHFHTSKAKLGQLREDAPLYHVSKPDKTKLTRSTEDAFKGILWADDSQIVEGRTTKYYGPQPGCHVEVVPLEGACAEVKSRDASFRSLEAK
ncbi:MAG TPA: RusA family crossover junction endodeoxyribonuclease [Xanthobacteraceae bacterium]|jgi:Holliday junction resolvase RusA-like endonuclease|nr:RusA family crossover junction endodeoxyribonuclease [Xanthobacteraceae bacterium]